MSSPSFDNLADPQQAQLAGAAMMTRSRGRFSGKGLRDGRRRSKALTVEALRRFPRPIHLHRRLLRAPRAAIPSAQGAAPYARTGCRRVHVEPCRSPGFSRAISASECDTSALALAASALEVAASASAATRRERSWASSASALARSSGSSSVALLMTGWNHIRPRHSSVFAHPADVGRQVFCGIRQSMPSSR